MKTIIQSFVFSFVIHLIYIVGRLASGYIKTNHHQPDIAKAWENGAMFQQEVACGTPVSPLFFLCTFLGVR